MISSNVIDKTLLEYFVSLQSQSFISGDRLDNGEGKGFVGLFRRT